MTFCGLHPDMEVGLDQYARGVSKAIRAKAEGFRRSNAGQIAVEQNQLSLLCFEAEVLARHVVDDEVRLELEAFAGLAKFTLYLVGLGSAVEGDASAAPQLAERAERMARLIERCDDIFEAQPQGDSDVTRLRHALRVLFLSR